MSNWIDWLKTIRSNKFVMMREYIAPVWKRVAKAILVVVLVGLAWLTFIGFAIRSFGSRDLAEHSDCAIVLGAAVSVSHAGGLLHSLLFPRRREARLRT